jgi:potassium-dependent mechanosensitive channel
LRRLFSRALFAKILAALLICAAAPAPAQDAKPQGAPTTMAPTESAPPVDPSARLDAAKLSLDQIEARLATDSMTDGELVKIRASLDPISTQIQSVIAEVSPKMSALKARLDQLGSPPDPKANPPAAPEDPAVTQERADQQKLFSASDDLIKRANVAQLRIDQLAAQIAERRRTLFSNAVFQSSSSIVSPSLWMDVARDTTHNLSAAKGAVLDMAGQFGRVLSNGGAILFGLLLLVLISAVVAATLLARRVIPREKSGRPPSELQKAAAALWTALAVAAIPILAATALYALTDWFGLGGQEFKPLSDAFFRGVVLCAWAVGLGNAILAPSRPLWRPLDLSDRVAQRLMNLVLVVTGLIAFGKLFDALDEVLGASLPVSVAARGTFAMLVGLTLMRGLYGIVTPEDEEEEATSRPANLEDESPWWPPIRFAAWAATVAVIGADLLGYIALSSFLVTQIAWTGFVAGLLFLLLKIASEGLEQAFRPNSRISRGLVNSVGLRRESLAQIGALLEGVISLTLYAVAALLVMAPWGLQSHDMLGTIESAFFGFKLGDVTISPWSLLIALVLFALGYAITHAIQNWLERRYLPLTQLDQGLQASIRTSVGYIGFLIALLFAGASLGINLERLALVAGALSVGIGLGLQSVVNNFVSGLILLWERTIRVGDLVVIGEEQGYVRRINVRATEIETADRATMIVPNGNMMTGVVKNFVRGDRIGRIKIPIQVVAGSDPEKVREILTDAARSQDQVVGIPAPTVLFMNFGANSLDFELICFVEEVERAGRVRSDVLYAIFKAFAEAGLKTPSTSTSLDLDVSKFEPMLQRLLPGAKDIKP